MSKKILIALVFSVLFAFTTKNAFASLSFSTDSILGTTAATLDFGSGNTLSLQTTENGPIITGTGLFTVGGNLKINGLASSGTQCLRISSTGVVSGTGADCASGTGTVTAVSVTSANGISGSVATATITPAITLTLGAITPTSVNGITLSGSATPTLAVTGTSSISGANTGDNADTTGKSAKTDALNSASTIVDVSAALAPSANQILTATDSTHATWVTPTGSVSCQPGLGDGLNAIPAGTYLQSTCQNDTGVTVTISAIRCFTDNAGASTMNVTNGAGTSLLTGSITCGNTKNPLGTAGTQSATVTLVNGDSLSFTFISDGTSKQTTWVITEH